MKKLYLFIFYIAFIGICKAAPSHEKERLQAVQRKRFLYQTVSFCFGPCSLRCANGYQKSHMGCYNCACAGSSVYLLSSNLNSNQFVPSNFSLNAGHIGHFFTNPCDPSIRHCPLQCARGYKQEANGCEHCACVDLPLSAVTANPLTTIAKSTRPPSVASAKPTIAKGSTTATLTTSSIKPVEKATTKAGSGYYDPCIPTQTVCDLDCNNDYVLGPERCQYCLCADKIPPHLRPTTTKVPAIPSGSGQSNLDLRNSSKAVSKPTPEACVMAKVICNEKCPGGFISKPDDCLFCSCLANTAPSDEIARVTLRKPCLFERQSCKTKCSKGYVKGPRNCQFCSCMKQ